MSQFLSYALPGIPYGCVFALLAMGLVLTYKASGVFNLAFGAQAYVSAVVFYEARRHGWPTWAAFVVSVLLLAPALGLVLDRLLFRYTRTAPTLVKLVPALGLLLALPAITQMVFGGGQRLAPPALFLDPRHVYFRVGSLSVDGLELATVLITAVSALVLALLFRSGGLGLRMRAVVESPRMTELAGIDADRVGAFAWMLSSFFAGLAGVLLAPVFATLVPGNFTDLLVAAIAAAAFGGFTSLPLTFLGGILLGVLQEIVGGYLPSGTILASGLRPSFPFLILVVLLVTMPVFRDRGEVEDPLAACDPPPASLRPPARLPNVALGVRAFTALVAVVLVVSALTWVSGNWLFTLTQGLVLAVVFLSITLLTGMAGQISLCQATFAGVGAFTAGQLAVHHGVPVLTGAVVGGLLAAVVGALVAIPTLRLGGIALALVTLSFALVADNILFAYSWAGNGASGVSVPRPTIGSLNFAVAGPFFWLVLAVLAMCAGALVLVRGGTTGQALAAVRGSEIAARAVGVDVTRLRVVAFALSAALAGVGGVLYGSLQQTVSPHDFNYQFSLVFVVVVAVVGVNTVAGAIEAGLAFAVLQQQVSSLPARYSSLLAAVFGLAALSYVRHPEGVVAFGKRWLVDRVEQVVALVRRHEAPGAPRPGPASSGTVGG
ncbi:MAG TPA: ABC transporter permease [Acidimicrobiales bacterium]|nr:ABC transporter permease [Acidimicrobiales bacterium]